MDYIDVLIEAIEPHPIREVDIGLFDTLVVSRFGGLASTLRPDYPGPHGGVKHGGHLTGLDLRELAFFAHSSNYLESSLGIAAINSFFNDPEGDFQELNGIDLIRAVSTGKRLAFIGHFPFVDLFRGIAAEVMVFEKAPRDGDIPDCEMPHRLPAADVVVITSTTLSNHSLDKVLSSTRHDAYRILLGPSTPLSPVLFDFGINALCGTVVRDVELVSRFVREAVPFRDIQGISHVTLLKERLHD